VRLWVRRHFIVRFLIADAGHLTGARYDPHALIEADRPLADYYRWLAAVARGEPAPAEGDGARAGAVSQGVPVPTPSEA
jgi:hypothetical protein